ncbi:MAG: hypothetical protein H5U22_06730 [Rhizobium sp.]|nr:hypothetical protein [Rhizobium sp.]
MTRPTILDLDLVVVPREATEEMRHANTGQVFFFHAYTAMLSASPYPTAWDDVRKYVEKLEVEAKCDEEYLDLVKEKYRAAEARIAELEKRLADAERVIEPFRKVADMADDYPSGSSIGVNVDRCRAARAYMEGK